MNERSLFAIIESVLSRFTTSYAITFCAAENFNFVLGEASPKHRSGIFSFGRFPPSTFDADNPQDLTEITGDIIWKLIKVGAT